MAEEPVLRWQEGEGEKARSCQARWRSARASPPPKRVVVVDDSLPANTAYRWASEGTGLLWRGDFNNARHLLDALKRRLSKPARHNEVKPQKGDAPATAAPLQDAAARFYRYRQSQSQRARVLSMLLIPLQADYGIALRRAPDWKQPLQQAWGAPEDESTVTIVAPLQDLLGANSACEWRRKGVEMAALGPPPHNRIHPHYGVYSPVRGEYVQLVADAPWPAHCAAGSGIAFDIGTGTGVLAAVLARRGAARVVATDLQATALACAADNLQRLGLTACVQLLQADLFPPGRADVVVCNPPWLPLQAASALEQAVYDPGSRMLRGFLQGLTTHLLPGGEGWLILSDLAEHLQLRSRAELLSWIEAANLRVLARLDTRPTHRKAHDPTDPLHAARCAEVTSLWRLAAA